MNIENVGEVYSDDTLTTLVDSATTTFDIADENTITMTKTVDRPNETYFSGDNITFTITITNNGDSTVTGLVFRDVINENVEPINGSDFTVTATSGTVTSSASPVTVSDINITAGSTVVITITGRIV